MGPRAELAHRVAVAVDRVRGVQRSGTLVFSTLYPGGRINGIVLRPEELRVHVDVSGEVFGQSLFALGELVRQAALEALRGAGDRREVRVEIDDLIPSGSAAPAKTP